MIPGRGRVVRIIVMIVSLGLAVSAGRTILELWQRRDIVRERAQELTKLREENMTLERTLQDIGGEAYAEKIARDKLGMVREGETIVIMPQEENSNQKTENKEALPNWKKWWKLFF